MSNNNNPQGQPQPQPNQGKHGHGFKYSFSRSTWITTSWNWVLMLGSKAAEPVLTVSVIYACARLLPSVHTPQNLDNVMTTCQMVALDFGGLGLAKLANQARKDGNETGALLASRVSTGLLTIMGINVALSVLESIAHLNTNFTSIVEGILLIARAIMAVLYAYVIHSLHGEEGTDPQGGNGGNGGGQPGVPPISPEDMQQAIDQALANQRAMFEQRFQTVNAEQSRLLTVINQLQSVPGTVPPINDETIIAGVIGKLETRVSTAMKRMESEVEQRVRVSLVQDGTNGSVSHVQGGTALTGPRLVSLPARSTSSGTLKRTQLERENAAPTQDGSGEVVDYKTSLYKLLDEDNTRQVADLVQITGFPKTTVWRYWSRYRDEQGKRGQGQIETNETEEAVAVEA
jgi:hypothetical protein